MCFQLKRRSLQEKPSGSDEGAVFALLANRPFDSDAHGSASSIKGEKVGDETPVQDFEAMVSRRDSPEWVDKAIAEMKKKIHNLVEDSSDGDHYPTAVECLNALRKACILEQVRVCFLNVFQWL